MHHNPFNSAEIDQFRADTPGSSRKLHFNNAGASLPVKQVLERVTGYMEEEALNGAYETEAKYQAEIDKTYDSIAKLINVTPSEIALVENASVGWCIAFYGIDFKPGDEVLVSELEYVTNLIGFFNARDLYGISIVVIPNDEQGNFSLEQLEAAITPRSKLIAVTHIASGTGGIIPVEAIGRMAARHNILYLLDACQSVGQMPVDARAIGCHFLSVTGRKHLRAPRGTGFLYVRQEFQDKLKTLFIDGHALEWITEERYQTRHDAKRFEFHEKNRALSLGLGRAVEYALSIGLERIRQRNSYLADILRNGLREISGITVHDFGDELSGIVTFSLAGIAAQTVKEQLAAQEINVSVALARSTLLFMNKHQLQSTVRASVHYYNTEVELETLLKALQTILQLQLNEAIEIK
jgi:cysteine desulfurase/selenocysteine lyase